MTCLAEDSIAAVVVAAIIQINFETKAYRLFCPVELEISADSRLDKQGKQKKRKKKTMANIIAWPSMVCQ